MRNANEVKAEISKLQAIQKTHRQTDSAWIVASELLQPLFAEMAQIANGKPL
jgi:hypothetical protein